MSKQTSAINDQFFKNRLRTLEYLAPLGDLGEAVRRFQRHTRLAVSGELDEETREKLLDRRCLVPDQVTTWSGRGRYVLSGCKWGKKHLTFAFVNFPSRVSKEDTRAANRRALDDWEANCGLTFEEVSDPSRADVTIGFIQEDGPGGTLGWAGFPGACGGTYAGTIRLDDAERWDASPGGSLQGTLCHEWGHTIGIAHTEKQGMLMYAYSTGGSSTVQSDDRAAAQALYGEPANPSPTPSPGDIIPLTFVMTATHVGKLAGSGSERYFGIKDEIIRYLEGAGVEELKVSLKAQNVDFDVYGRWGEPPKVVGELSEDDVYDYGSYTPKGTEDFVVPLAEGMGRPFYLLVQSYEGLGNFQLVVTPQS